MAYLIPFHEVWRDETHAYSMAIGANSYWDIFRVLRECNEGHPMLWHMTLRFFYQCVHSPLALPAASLTAGCLAMFVFFKYAPFSRPEKIIFALGYFPLYEYSVIARSYGFVMLFIFIFCALYPKRNQNIILIALTLSLMANTTIHGLIVALVLGASLKAEFLARLFLRRENISTKEIKKFSAAAGIVFLGFMFSVIQIMPTSESIIRPNFTIWDIHVFKYLAYAAACPGKFFYQAFDFNPYHYWALTCFIFVLGVYLWRKPFILMIWAGATIALGVFFQWAYPVSMRHFGIYFLCFIAALWLGWEKPRIKSRIILWMFWVVLLLQLQMSYREIREEIKYNFSSSKDFGQWLKQNPRFDDALLIGEPDYISESMVYYCDNRIYMARQKQFAKWVTWTNINQKVFSLEELLAAARKLKGRENVPVLIMLGHVLGDKDYEEIPFGYSRIFTYTRRQKEDFLNSTQEMADFSGSYSGLSEDYKIYLVL